MRELIDDATDKWYDLGLELHLRERTLKAIKANENDVHDRFREMISAWLHEDGPPPTWDALIIALKKRSVRLTDVANKVEEACRVGGYGTSGASTPNIAPTAAAATTTSSGLYGDVITRNHIHFYYAYAVSSGVGAASSEGGAVIPVISPTIPTSPTVLEPAVDPTMTQPNTDSDSSSDSSDEVPGQWLHGLFASIVVTVHTVKPICMCVMTT